MDDLINPNIRLLNGKVERLAYLIGKN